MHKIEFEVIDIGIEVELLRMLDWFIEQDLRYGYGSKPPKGSKTMAKHVRHQMTEGKRKAASSTA